MFKSHSSMLYLGIALAWSSLAVMAADNAPESGKRVAAKRILDQFVTYLQGRNPEGGAVQMRGRLDVLSLLRKRYWTLSDKVRHKAVGYVYLLGADLRRPPEHRWLVSKPAIGFFVEIFAKDSNEDCCQSAARILVEMVPDSHVRTHAREIVKAAGNRRASGWIALLLGKIGSQAARDILLKMAKAHEGRPGGHKSAQSIDLALAKLGDTKRSRKYIEAFQKADEIYRKASLAKKLGYIADAGSMKALGKEFRNPLRIEEVGSDYFHKFSLRFAIAEALSLARPENELFWFPYENPPVDDTRYVKIEKWLEAELGMKWTRPRPKFTDEGVTPRQLPQ